MVFASPIFLFVFLPIFFTLYYIFPKHWRNVVIIGASLFFYMWGEAKLVIVMLASTFVDYLCALVIAHAGIRHMWQSPPKLVAGEHRTRTQRIALVVSLTVNLGFLLFFKYANWGIENVTSILHSLGLTTATAHRALAISLPLGISFYTFQSMSYSIDVYRGHAQATRNLLNYATLITKFPLLIAGPIIRYADVAQQLVTRVMSVEKFAYGVRRFTVGLGKKVLIANAMAVPADAIFALPADQLSAPVAWFGVLAYALQIYFDFSGYSDMAIGLGAMLGFTFLENFNFPYIAGSVRDFWRRWHISLSSWFRDYVYIPMGGNRGGTARTYFNLIFVFFVTGLWHGASWTFVVWGLFYGVFLVLERLWPKGWSSGKLRPLGHVYTLLVVLVAWVFFRADSMSAAGHMLHAMVGAHTTNAVPLMYYLNGKTIVVFILGVLGSMPLLRTASEAWIRRQVRVGTTSATVIIQAASAVLLLGVFLLAVMQLAGGSYNPFIYYRF